MKIPSKYAKLSEYPNYNHDQHEYDLDTCHNIKVLVILLTFGGLLNLLFVLCSDWTRTETSCPFDW